jgi:hypothetical protein
MSVVKIGWSGGKDSSCAVMKHIERGDKVKAVCYVPMFTETIPLLLERHYSFIIQTAKYFERLGADVHIVSGMTYWDYVTHRAKRGKYKGEMFGFPCFVVGQCGFKRDSKLKALQNCDVGKYDYECIAIAADEKKRHSQLTDLKRSILVEENITEEEAKQYCKENGILSPLYELSARDGCVLCPNAKKEIREIWFDDFKDAKPLLIELQEIVKKEKPHQTPLRNYEWFI